MERWIVIVAVLFSAISILLYRRRTRKILERVRIMLDEAIDGNFNEEKYDESMLSSVELKMAKYLASSEVSKQNLEAEKKKIKELISDISHQTKTPIANIMLFSELLKEQELTEESASYVSLLNEQAEKLKFLIAALVKTSRLENGIMEVHPSIQPIEPMLEQVMKQITPIAQNKKLEVKMKSTDERAVFDKKWTEEAIYNVVHNAVKYTPEGGKIEIQVIPYEFFTAIQVKDTGIGIAEAEHAKIFGRFYRSPQVHEKEGVGIGLFLARQIVANEGGYIKVFSKLGEGATFSIYLAREEKRNEIFQNC